MKVPHDVLSSVDWSDADADPTCWKYHIPLVVRGNWEKMGGEARTTAMYMAQQSAKHERTKAIVTKGPITGGLSRGWWSE